MSDPIDRMAQFRSEVEGGPMLPAADVRARGDKLRRRRTAALTAGAALAVAAIVTPVALLATGGTATNDGPDPAEPSRTTDSTAPTDALTEAALLTEAETEYDGSARWLTQETLTGEPMWAACEVGPPTDELGATTDFQRRFTLDTDDPEVADRQPRMTQVVAEFVDEDTARHAFENVMTMYDSGDCAPQGAINDGPVVPPMWTVDIGDGVEARVSLSTFLYAPGDDAALVTAGIAVVGDRLTVVSMVVPHDSSLASETGSPMPAMLRTAAAKLGAEVSPPAPGGLSDANLLRDEDTVFTDEVRWTLVDTYPGEGQAALHACESQTLTEHGAVAVFRREWYVNSGIHFLAQGIAEFPSPAAAQQAHAAIREEVMACEQHASDDWTASTTSDGPGAGVDDRMTLISGSFSMDGEEGGEAFNDHDLVVGLATVGNRITVLAHDHPTGTEWPLGEPVELMLPAAAERLVLDARTDQPSTNWRTDIPGDIPIDRGLSAPEGDPVQGPTPDMDAINEVVIDGADLFPGPEVERLVAFATGPEFLDGRELHTYQSDSEAAQVLQQIRDAQQQSPESGGVIWTVHDVDGPGEESLTLSRTLDFGLGTDIFQFTRVGNAILAIDLGGEWSLDTSVASGIDSITGLSSAIAPEMCIYSAEGC